jgi:SAM-dependent methyltransferase
MATKVEVPDNSFPHPPLELANRVGSLSGAPNPLKYYDVLGRETRDAIVAALPAGWTFEAKRILDFGCGAGRTLGHFAAETAHGELCGCDIDEPSIAWMKEHMSPPFHVFLNGAEPPVEQPDASFDLIWAVSVFTHLVTSWSQWLVELHRLLKPDGLLLATFMGRGMVEEIASEPWDENKFGMNVIRYGQSWDLGGPMVIHAPWWIEEHWGQAFQILSLTEDGFASKPWLDHGVVLMRKRDVRITPADLERRDPADRRETSALAHNVEQLLTESKQLREGLGWAESRISESEIKLSESEIKLSSSEADGRRLESELKQSRDTLTALQHETTSLRKKAFTSERETVAMRETSAESARKLLAVEEALAQAKARIFALEERADEMQELVDDTQAKVERAQGVMAAMQASLSWRATTPLRALKPRKRR